jgi:hypothetical protein
LKKSPSHNYPKLSSQDDLIVLLDAELRGSCLSAGLLCLHGNYRYKIDSNTTVDLFHDKEFIATVQLTSDFVGDKNGYLPDIILKVI